MKKTNYITNPFPFIVFGCFMFISSVIIVLLGEYLGSLLAFLFGAITLTLILIFRKTIFSKGCVDEHGIKVLYKNEIIKQILWEEINYVQAIATNYGGQLIFSKQPLFTGKDSWKNLKEIYINLNGNLAVLLFEYKHKIPVSITDLHKLPKKVQTLFQD